MFSQCFVMAVHSVNELLTMQFLTLSADSSFSFQHTLQTMKGGEIWNKSYGVWVLNWTEKWIKQWCQVVCTTFLLDGFTAAGNCYFPFLFIWNHQYLRFCTSLTVCGANLNRAVLSQIAQWRFNLAGIDYSELLHFLLLSISYYRLWPEGGVRPVCH